MGPGQILYTCREFDLTREIFVSRRKLDILCRAWRASAAGLIQAVLSFRELPHWDIHHAGCLCASGTGLGPFKQVSTEMVRVAPRVGTWIVAFLTCACARLQRGANGYAKRQPGSIIGNDADLVGTEGLGDRDGAKRYRRSGGFVRAQQAGTSQVLERNSGRA